MTFLDIAKLNVLIAAHLNVIWIVLLQLLLSQQSLSLLCASYVYPPRESCFSHSSSA